MRTQNSNRRTRRDGAVAVLAVIATVILLRLPPSVGGRVKALSRAGLSPFEELLALKPRAENDTSDPWTDSSSVIEERRRLLTEIARLRHESRLAPILRQENEFLKRLLSFRTRHSYELIPCEVVTRNPVSGWWQQLRMNRGTAAGIAADMAVITAEGLVGRTTDPTVNSCDVLLLTDPGSRVACRIARTGATGIVRGSGYLPFKGKTKLEMLCNAKPYRMDYLPTDQDVLKGDEVVTSGLGGVFPPGIPVGQVTAVWVDSSGLFQHAEVRPAADLETLTYVFVVGASRQHQSASLPGPGTSPGAKGDARGQLRPAMQPQ